jgi:hypothetical protein
MIWASLTKPCWLRTPNDLTAPHARLVTSEEPGNPAVSFRKGQRPGIMFHLLERALLPAGFPTQVRSKLL